MMASLSNVDEITRRSVESFLARVHGKFPILEVRLFGSRARGDAKHDSDVDVAVILNGPKRRSIEIAAEMADAGFEVLMETGRVVSIVPIAAEDWRDPSLHSNPFLIANIKREGLRFEL